MSKKIFGLVGAGGYGRETIHYIKNNKDDFEIFFIDKNINDRDIRGIKVISDDDFFSIKCDKKFFNVSVSDSFNRKKIVDHYISNGVQPIDLHATTFINHGTSDIGEGSIISDYSIISADVKIGKFFHCNRLSQVGHDVQIGNYVTFAPQVNCNGNTIIDDFAYLGTNCILRHGQPNKPLRIGKGAIIGMGAVVTKDVPSNTTVVGNPAREITKESS